MYYYNLIFILGFKILLYIELNDGGLISPLYWQVMVGLHNVIPHVQ